MIKIRKGLDLPISGRPEQKVEVGNAVRTVAIVGDDYIGMRPTMEVDVGDRVKLGQLLFTDKKTEGVRYTSPGAGTVKALHRGEKRKFESIVIELDGDEEETFASYSENDVTTLDREEAKQNLVRSGMWTALRTRPFSKVPAVDTAPRSIFVNAMDTNPLAADPAPLIQAQAKNFELGIRVLARLTDGTVFVCKAPGASIPGEGIDRVRVEEFSGPHPAGLAGTHIHNLDPVSESKTVWTIGYQDVIAYGHLFATGQILVDRIVSLAGPVVTKPRLVRTRLGACLTELLSGEYAVPSSGDNGSSADGESPVRIISGSVLSGRHASGLTDYLGRYHNQVSVLLEGRHREFLGWQKPGFDKFSIKNIFASAMSRGSKKFDFTTSTQGSRRAIVPIGTYEKVMPLDVVATPLLKSLIVTDTESAQQLGALELDEEDLALCTFVCPGKYDYGRILRRNLTQIEREG